MQENYPKKRKEKNPEILQHIICHSNSREFCRAQLNPFPNSTHGIPSFTNKKEKNEKIEQFGNYSLIKKIMIFEKYLPE